MVQQPAVDQQIHRRVGGGDGDFVEQAVPVLMDDFQLVTRRAFTDKARDQRFGLCRVLPAAEDKNKGALIAVNQRGR